LQDKEETMNKVLKFMKNGKIPNGLSRFLSSNINKNSPISSSSAANISQGPGYQPKRGGIGKSLRLYTDIEIQEVVNRTRKYLDLFGYCMRERSLEEVKNNDSSSNSKGIKNIDNIFDNIRLENKRNNNDSSINSSINNSIYSGISCNEINSSLYECKNNPNEISNFPGTVINILYSIRGNDDKYGRLISNLRRRITDNDKNPFEIN
jgi:hypothetical protein